MKKLNLHYLLFSISFIIFNSCTTDKIKEKINKTGDVAGQALGEFSSGVKTGVEKAVEPKIEINARLKKVGIDFGKMTVSGDSSNIDNILTAYLIFNENYKGTITAKAFDKNNLEMGRVKINIKGIKDEAKYVDFHFDKRTDIANDSRLTLE
ncbi:hypothetical protein [Solitalea lacus]|uniref:hypothetical protein n=1 Tax=Solitalea lacus TaxID=2911172 RepID=UPI001EDB0A1B|nr:hypothetical protein [Solitalea lacus]UKJ06012.1 hypothetical protein L2B55_10685 [Solitalea lacus]